MFFSCLLFCFFFLFSISHLFTRILSFEYRHPSSIAILWLHAVFGNLALPLSLTSFHHWLFWLWCCLCSLSKLNRCCERRAPPAVLCVVVYDSVVRFWPPPTPLCGLRHGVIRWFAVGALAPRESSLQHRGLLFVKIGFFWLKCLSVIFASCAHSAAGASLVTVARYFPSRVLMTFSLSLWHARGLQFPRF